MNPNLNALRIAMLQCLSSPDVTADEVTEVIRETARAEMDAGTDKTKKCRTILEKLRIPYHYTSCPDFLKDVWTERESDDTMVSAVQAAQPVADGILGGMGEDIISLG